MRNCGTRAIDNTGCRVAMVASMGVMVGGGGGGGGRRQRWRRWSHVTSHLITFERVRWITRDELLDRVRASTRSADPARDARQLERQKPARSLQRVPALEYDVDDGC